MDRLLAVFWKSFWAIPLLSIASVGTGAEVPLEILADEASVIVAGKVIERTPFRSRRQVDDRSRRSAAAIMHLEVTQVFKGLEQLQLVRVLLPQGQRAGKESPASLEGNPLKVGQEGIWLLGAEVMPGVYQVNRQGAFLTSNREDEIKHVLAQRAILPGGQTVRGLVARAEVVSHPQNFEVRFSVKNTSDKAIVLCDYVGNRPLEVEWIDPAGQRRKSGHYQWLARAFLAPLQQKNFVVLQPGGVHFMGPRGAREGMLFVVDGAKPAGKGSFNRVQPGAHQVTVRYSNSSDGSRFGHRKVWKGTVTANLVSFTVK